jgi:hypothetical protein
MKTSTFARAALVALTGFVMVGPNTALAEIM